jgi:hypothetical protein
MRVFARCNGSPGYSDNFSAICVWHVIKPRSYMGCRSEIYEREVVISKLSA